MPDNKAILTKLKTSLTATFGALINEVILFGSQANGTANEDSDYDILIILNNDYDQHLYDAIFDCIFETGLEYNILFDMHIVSTNEMEHTIRGAEPIFYNAIKNGVHV